MSARRYRTGGTSCAGVRSLRPRSGGPLDYPVGSGTRQATRVGCRVLRFERGSATRGPRMARMTSYLHTMVRITDPERSQAFYEALGFTRGKESPIVRNGELEATNYFMSLPGQPDVLELT